MAAACPQVYPTTLTSYVEVSPKRFARRRTRETVAFLHRETTEEMESAHANHGDTESRRFILGSAALSAAVQFSRQEVSISPCLRG